MLTDIVLDAVGSDKAPEPEIRGAIMACRKLPVRVHLVGPEAELHDLVDEYLDNEDLPIVIHHASERIGMEEKAAQAVRTKKDSSMRVGLKLVREGKAAGFVMQWNSGSMWELLPHVASPQPADLCLYGSGGKATHVTIVEKLTPDGLVAIIGENGGGSNTTTPATAKAQGAFAKRVPTHLYRSGFLGFCSLVDIAEGRVSAKMF